MFDALAGWWRERFATGDSDYSDDQWREAMAGLPLLEGFSGEQAEGLQQLARAFLRDKAIEGAGGHAISERMRLSIALLSALPILNLGLTYYRHWYAVVVYPAGFRAQHEYVDEAGAVHHMDAPLVGEAWEQGPVILSWEDIEASGQRSGFNVVIHELAHKLDMLWEGPNGMPPLHREMSRQEWTQAWSAAFQDFRQRSDAGEPLAIDAYAAESPGEFFAVLSEAFFELPHELNALYPRLYQQLLAFYRQDPLVRLPGRSGAGDGP